ncbi:MAG: HD-GYP domain-containing protein [Actinobacteria bacterium]|nr:HD-GYP domain-containing protein [Actinomycetota bacterium]
MSITTSPRRFTSSDLELLETFSNGIAIAIKNFKLISDIKKNFVQTLKAFANSIDAKDKYTKSHSQNVSNIAGLIAYKCGLGSDKVEEVMIAGLLHDIGKIGIPDSILAKGETLSKEEYDLVKKHPVISFKIIGEIGQFKSILPIILYHHERWDGKGYPQGLRGEEIPLGARILAIADAYDAITTDRPYRKAFCKRDAIAEIRKNAGSQFDPELVEIFVKIIS